MTKKIHFKFPGTTSYHGIGHIDILADSRVCSMRAMCASFRFQAIKYCWQLFQEPNRKQHTHQKEEKEEKTERRQGDKDATLTCQSTRCPCLNCLHSIFSQGFLFSYEPTCQSPFPAVPRAWQSTLCGVGHCPKSEKLALELMLICTKQKMHTRSFFSKTKLHVHVCVVCVLGKCKIRQRHTLTFPQWRRFPRDR